MQLNSRQGISRRDMVPPNRNATAALFGGSFYTMFKATLAVELSGMAPIKNKL